MNDIVQRIEKYKTDRRHGASQLLDVALEILMDAARELPAEHGKTIIARLDGLAAQMADARPGMANIDNVMSWYRKSLTFLDLSADKETVREKALERAGRLRRYCLEASRLLIANAVRSIVDCSAIMTCSFSSTVLRILKEAYRTGARFSVLVLESCWRDCCYGAFMNRELKESGIGSRLIRDAEAARYLPGTDLVILGADTLFSDGTLINGFPSRELAAAAAAHRPAVPVIALLESFKISGQPETGEIPDGFQAIPFYCLAGVITEKGLHRELLEIQALSESNGPEEFFS